VKFPRALFSALFVFCTLSFIFFLIGNAYQFSQQTQLLLLRAVRMSGIILFIYAFLMTIAYLIRRLARKTGVDEPSPALMLVLAAGTLACAVIASIIIQIAHGTQ
jgi:hypothetical protein